MSTKAAARETGVLINVRWRICQVLININTSFGWNRSFVPTMSNCRRRAVERKLSKNFNWISVNMKWRLMESVCYYFIIFLYRQSRWLWCWPHIYELRPTVNGPYQNYGAWPKFFYLSSMFPKYPYIYQWKSEACHITKVIFTASLWSWLTAVNRKINIKTSLSDPE